MKFAYLSFPGWQIEVPISAGGRTGSVREFIHSLSPRYIEKHMAYLQGRRNECHHLKNTPGLHPLWIFDGNEFVSARRRLVRRDGI